MFVRFWAIGHVHQVSKPKTEKLIRGLNGCRSKANYRRKKIEFQAAWERSFTSHIQNF